MDVPTYLTHVRTRLGQEEQRVVHYLHLSTRKPLLATTLQTLLATHVDAVIEKGFSELMEQSRLHDLQNMYSLYALVDALPKLRVAFVRAAPHAPAWRTTALAWPAAVAAPRAGGRLPPPSTRLASSRLGAAASLPAARVAPLPHPSALSSTASTAVRTRPCTHACCRRRTSSAWAR